jgi:hypothetical protein
VSIPPPVLPNAVFLNIPYDDRFRRQYLAYIVGLSQPGLQPKATLGIPGGERRLDRILALIQSCRPGRISRTAARRKMRLAPESAAHIQWNHRPTWSGIRTRFRSVDVLSKESRAATAEATGTISQASHTYRFMNDVL